MTKNNGKIRCNTPKKYHRFILNDKCPKCGSELHGKIYDHKCYVWCTNHPHCDYKDLETGRKNIYWFFETHGGKTVYGTKTVTAVIMFNRPIKPKK